jgi:hypothetical protein
MDAKLPIFIAIACVLFVVLFRLNDNLENVLEALKSLNAYLQIELTMD